MARALTGLLSLLCCLPLLLELQHFLEARNETAVQAPTEVHGHPGDTVKLPCSLQPGKSSTPKVTQITWTRQAPSGERRVVAVLHPLYGPRIPESNRVEFAAAGWGADLRDASLMVFRLRPEDEANYTCEITTLEEGSKSAATWLRVFYAPQVSISRSADTRQWNHKMTILTCDARSNPEPKSYDWSTTTGPLPPSAVPQGSRLLIQLTEASINKIFICRVSNDLGTGQATMRVLFPDPASEESFSNLFKISLVGITILLATSGISALVLVPQKTLSALLS